MKSILRITAILAALSFSATAAAQIEISPGDCAESGADYVLGETCWTSDETRQPDSNSLSTWTGVGEDMRTELYKAEVGGDDDPGYTTTFTNSADDPSDATIVWDGGGFIDCSEGCYLTVKDGNHSPSLYVFDISDWNGQDSIILTDFWPRGGAISNVAIWGGGGETKLPEPGTLALLGLGLLGMGLIRRRHQV